VVVMMVMIMRGHKFRKAITAFGLNRVSALASSMANILAPSHLGLVLAFKTRNGTGRVSGRRRGKICVRSRNNGVSGVGQQIATPCIWLCFWAKPATAFTA
jgi:hypothetical protein